MQCLAELIQESMHQNLLNVRYFKLLLYTLQYQSILMIEVLTTGVVFYRMEMIKKMMWK